MIEINFDSKKRLGILSGDLFNEIREHFSVKNESAAFMRRYGRFIPQRTYAITPTGRFEPGLFVEIKKFLTTNQYAQKLNVHDDFIKEIMPAKEKWLQHPDFNFNEANLSLSLRDYQKEIVDKALNLGRGTIVLATAGGKTLTAASLLSKIYQINLNFKCLYVVPDLGLVEQTSKDFLSYNVPFCMIKWTGTNPLENKHNKCNVIVANLGILQSKNSDISWIEDIDVLVVDECLRANTLIFTDKGHKKIQDIKPGDNVLSYNSETHRKEFKPVLNTWKNLIKSNSYTKFIEIELEDGSIIQVTPNHKLYTQRGMVRADEIIITDDIKHINVSKFMYLRYKYLYAVKNLQTYLLSVWQSVVLSRQTSKV